MNRLRTLLIVLIFAGTVFYSANAAAGGNKCFGTLMTKDPEVFSKTPCAMLLFWDWQAKYNVRELNAIWNAGAVPMITLEPWIAGTKLGVPLKDIAGGLHDDKLFELAGVLKEFGRPVFLRFAHEMNGNWYPWGASGRDAYIAAYRHVHDVINKTAGQNARPLWVFSVNAASVPDEEWNRADQYYPGGEFVDALGIDGYNMSAVSPRTGWKIIDDIYVWLANLTWGRTGSFSRIFGDQVALLSKAFPDKIILITEVATSLYGKNRQAWINDMFWVLANRYGNIPLFVWFDVDKETDWRLGSDDAVLKAFNYDLELYRFGMGRNELLKKFKR